MDSPGVAEGVTTSMGDLSVEATPSSSVTGIAKYGNGGDAAGEDDDIWDDASDSPGHTSNLDREWIHRQNQFQKMGYRDGITEGQKDSAQEGFNVGFRQSVNVGYKRGLVRGVTSALSSLPGSLKEKLVPDSQCRSKLQDVHSSAQEISADESLQMFHESICRVIILQRNIKVYHSSRQMLFHVDCYSFGCGDRKFSSRVVLVLWLLSVIGNFCLSITIAYIGTIALVTIPA